MIPQSAKFWWGKTLWQIDFFRVFFEENVDEFTIANNSYFSESEIKYWVKYWVKYW